MHDVSSWVLVATAVLATAPGSSWGQCPFNAHAQPAHRYDLDFNGLPLDQSNHPHIFNYYYSGNWDAVPGNPPMAQIDLATEVVIAAHYFDRACQYGTTSVFWKGSGTSNNFFGDFPCGGKNPPGNLDLGHLLHFFMCQEGLGQAGFPAFGTPDYATCHNCELGGGFDCYMDPACLASPNATGDTIYNIFLPANTSLNELGGGATAFHFQFPSNRIGSYPPVPQTGVFGTSGRPLYIVIIPVKNNPTFAGLIETMTHEDIEVVTDPFPGASWINNADSLANAGHGEAADICQDHFIKTFKFVPPPFVGSIPTAGLPADMTGRLFPLSVARYWSNDGHSCPVPVVIDTLPPVTAASQSPPPNNNLGWTNQPVTVTLLSTDPAPDGTGVAQIIYSASGASTIAATVFTPPTFAPSLPAMTSFPISKEGITTVSFDAVDGAGLVEATKTATIMLDFTLPTSSPNPNSPPPNVVNGTSYGWNNTDVVVSFACSDGLSGIESCGSPGPSTVATEGANQVVRGKAVDNAGNTSPPVAAAPVNIDKTAPVITYSGNKVTYPVDSKVAISCTTGDTLAGLASDTCQPITGPAFSFGVGTSTFSASATDKAGNAATASVTFQVIVTFSSLGNLVRRFVKKAGVANALVAKLDGAEKAAANGNLNAKANILDAFRNELAAQTGKSISPTDADILLQLVKLL
jgi:hypothetical protein